MKKEKEEETELYMHMPKSLKQELQIIALREGSTMKDIINDITKDYVKKHKEGNTQHLISSFVENDDFQGFPSMGIDFINKKSYIEKFLQKDGSLNDLGKTLWGHVSQWQAELQKF